MKLPDCMKVRGQRTKWEGRSTVRTDGETVNVSMRPVAVVFDITHDEMVCAGHDEPGASWTDPSNANAPLPTPPLLGEVAPPLRCGRLLRYPDIASQCPKDATHHVIWNRDMDNTLDCDEHTDEAKAHEHYAIHPYEMACSMQAFGAEFHHDLNRCLLPGDVEKARAEAVVAAAR